MKLLLSTLLFSCQVTPVPIDGAWSISGSDIVGAIQARSGGGCGDGGVMVTLHGPGFTTATAVPAQAIEEEPGVVWLYFPLQTGLGDGEAALRLQGREAMLPMGGRAGEFEIRLALEEGLPDEGELRAQAEAAATALQAARSAWSEGGFRIVDSQGQLVGELRISADRAPLVAVYDRIWWTGGLVQADRHDEGPDIVLSFPVEPALRGEEAQLRVNAPLATAVVPADRVPTDLDRRLVLVPGAVASDEREVVMASARQQADAAEEEAMVGLARLLALRARTDDGRCRSWREVNPALSDVLVGYDLVVVEDGERCVVEIEPTVTQHRRRLRARVGPEGLIPDQP